MYVPVRAPRGRSVVNNDGSAKEELHVSIIWLLGFGAVKMSRACRSGTLTMCEIWPSCETFTNWISITKYALESVSVSSPLCIRSQSVCGRFCKSIIVPCQLTGYVFGHPDFQSQEAALYLCEHQLYCYFLSRIYQVSVFIDYAVSLFNLKLS